MAFRPSALAILAVAALAPAAARAQSSAGPSAPLPGTPRALRVTGEGRVSVRPDVAVLQAGVESTGPDLGRVTRDSAIQMRKVMSALTEAGIAEKDIQTTRHDVQVEREWKNGRQGPITGYTVSDEVRVTVRDVSRLGPLLERVAAAGANALRSLSFQKEDPTPERARALSTAYVAARTKAEALARAAGVTLGEVLWVSEAAQLAPLPVRGLMVARAAPEEGTPVSAGEVEIAATVDVTYALR